jgi:hypothetical protein
MVREPALVCSASTCSTDSRVAPRTLRRIRRAVGAEGSRGRQPGSARWSVDAATISGQRRERTMLQCQFPPCSSAAIPGTCSAVSQVPSASAITHAWPCMALEVATRQGLSTSSEHGPREESCALTEFCRPAELADQPAYSAPARNISSGRHLIDHRPFSAKRVGQADQGLLVRVDRSALDAADVALINPRLRG